MTTRRLIRSAAAVGAVALAGAIAWSWHLGPADAVAAAAGRRPAARSPVARARAAPARAAPTRAAPVLRPMPGSPFATGTDTFPESVAFSPSGRLLATADAGAFNGAGGVSVFEVAPDGRLHQLPGSPFSTGSGLGSGAVSLAFSPSGRLLATANQGAGTVSVLAVGANGAPTPVPGSPFATGGYDPYGRRPFPSYPSAVAFSPAGGLLAVANTDDSTVSVFAVAGDGSLRQIPGSPFTTGRVPESVAFNAVGSLLATGDPGRTGAVNYGSTISLFSITRSGTVTPVPGSPFSTATNAGTWSVAFSPSGSLLAASDWYANAISIFSVGPGGRLRQVPGSPSARSPRSIAFSPSGGLLATADTNGNAVSLFFIGRGGRLRQAPGSPFATGAGPDAIAFSPSGRLLAVANATAGSVSLFAVSSANPLRVLIKTRRAVVRRAATAVLLACAGGRPGSACRGRLTLSLRKRSSRLLRGQRTITFRTIVLASARYSMPRNRRSLTKLRLTRTGLLALRHARAHRLRVHADATLPGGIGASAMIALQRG